MTQRKSPFAAMVLASLAAVAASALSSREIAIPVGAQTGTGTQNVAVGPQYDTTHVYVAPQDFDRFVASLVATFGGTTTKQGVFTVTPTPSSTMSQLVLTPMGSISVFGFKTPVPYPFGEERTGYLVTDVDKAVKAARAAGADVTVTQFNDPIGRDVIIQLPGGVNTQLYWHTTAPSYPALQTVPENRVYVSPDRIEAFVRSFLTFSHGNVVSDETRAPGVEIGRPAETYRRIRIESKFGKLTALVTDGHLPYPYGREITGYEVTNLEDTLTKAKTAGVETLVAPYTADQRICCRCAISGWLHCRDPLDHQQIKLKLSKYLDAIFVHVGGQPRQCFCKFLVKQPSGRRSRFAKERNHCDPGHRPIAVEKGVVPMIDFIAGDEHEVTTILAYRLWEKRGRPLGSPEVDWLEAKSQLAAALKRDTAMAIFSMGMEPRTMEVPTELGFIP